MIEPRQGFGCFFPILVALLCLFCPIVPRAIAADLRCGLWVEAEGKKRPFASSGDFEDFKRLTGEFSFSELYLQVYRRGRAWYPTMFADDSPYREALADGYDPLGDAIKTAHSRGQKVFAWINLLRVLDNPDAPIFDLLGKRAALSDNFGNSLLDYNKGGYPPDTPARYGRIGTPGVWLDPAYGRLRAFLLALIGDLLSAYPQLDGVHLDMVRYPIVIGAPSKRAGVDLPLSLEALDLGYSFSSFAGYYGFSENVAPVVLWWHKMRRPPTVGQWSGWKKEQLTNFLVDIRALVSSAPGSKELSVAVIPEVSSAVRHAHQDWPTWVKRGIVDVVVPMSYTRNLQVFKRRSRQAMGSCADSSSKVLMGLGTWLMLDDHGMLRSQLAQVRKSGANGAVLFSYGNLFSSKRGKELLEHVSAQLKRSCMVELT